MRHLWALLLLLGSVQAMGAATGHGTPPSCAPGAYPGLNNYHVGESASGTAIGLMWCNDATGINYWAVQLDLGAPAPACLNDVAGTTDREVTDNAWAACVTGGFTADQQQELAVLLKQWMPHLLVAGPSPETVFIYDASCTVALITSCRSTPYVVDGERQTLNPGESCATAGGIDADSHLPYFSVAGLTSLQGAKLPAGTYAHCVTVYPPTDGW